jgi:hypothetical protein
MGARAKIIVSPPYIKKFSKSILILFLKGNPLDLDSRFLEPGRLRLEMGPE